MVDCGAEARIGELLTMASTGFISVIVLAIFAVLKVEGTARGAVPLDTLTFDKVFLKILFHSCLIKVN